MKRILSIILGVAVATIVAVRYQRPPKLPADRLVAHALGAVDGRVYTNSREAWLESRRAGFTYFEVDLMLTADSAVVASHVFHDGTAAFGVKGRVEHLTRDQFLARRYFGRYTPLDLSGVLALAQGCPSCVFILDAKDNREGANDMIHAPEVYRAIHARVAAASGHAAVTQQLWPQMYTEGDASVIAEMYGPAQPTVYTLYRTRSADAEVARFVRAHPTIQFVGAWFAPGHERLTRELAAAIAPVPVFAYTVNDGRRARRALKLGAAGLYTDHLRPR